MRITDIRVHILQKQLKSTMRISRGGFTVRRHAIVEVSTDAGITGLGEGIGSPESIRAIVRDKMTARAAGLDPFNIEQIRAALIDPDVYFERMGSSICAASAIEMACWDIKGKALDVPVYQLLGGRCRNVLEAYASDVYWEEDAGRMAENARRVVERGYRTVKIHIGARPPREEIPRLRAVRQAVGEKIELMVDLNAGYHALDALQATELWREFDIRWLEEPVSPNETSAMQRLCSKSPMPIAAGENEFRLHGFKTLLDASAADVIMPDIGRAGGLMETRNICALAGAHGVPVSPHNFSSGVLLAATVHLMASVPNTILLEMDTSGNAIYEELLTWKPAFGNGSLDVPECTGLGVTLPEAIVKQYGVN